MDEVSQNTGKENLEILLSEIHSARAWQHSAVWAEFLEKIHGFNWFLLEFVDWLSAVYERGTWRMLSEK